MTETDTIRIKEFIRHHGNALDNWIRWGRMKDHYPPSYKCILGVMVEKRKREDDEAPPPPAMPRINELDAEIFEALVIGLPEKQRWAFMLYFLGRAGVSGRMRYAKGRQDGIRALRISARHYNRLVRDAANTISRALGNTQ